MGRPGSPGERRGGGSRALWVWRSCTLWLCPARSGASRSSWLKHEAMCSAVSEQSPIAGTSLSRMADLGRFCLPAPGGLSRNPRGEGTRALRGLRGRCPHVGLSAGTPQAVGSPLKMK